MSLLNVRSTRQLGIKGPTPLLNSATVPSPRSKQIWKEPDHMKDSSQELHRRLNAANIASKIFESFKVEKIAKELTLVSQERLRSLNNRDFVKAGYKDTPRNQGKISDMMAQFVATTVLVANIQGSAGKAYEVAKGWITVAFYCLTFRNYNTIFEIVAGLQKSQVHRIVQLREKFMKLRSWISIKDKVSEEHNYKAYRDDYDRSKGNSCVPYFLILLKDMYGYEEGKPSICTKVKTPGPEGKEEVVTRMINWEKCLTISKKIEDVTIRRPDYNWKSDLVIRCTLEKMVKEGTLDNERLWNLSWDIRPKGHY